MLSASTSLTWVEDSTAPLRDKAFGNSVGACRGVNPYLKRGAASIGEMMLVEKGPISDALQRLARVTNGDETTVLGCAHLEARNGTLSLTATDLTCWFRVAMPCEGELHAVIPVESLLEFVRPMDRNDRGALVEFMSVERGQVVVAIERSMVTLTGLSTSKFPATPEMLKLAMASEVDSRDAAVA